MRPKSEIYTPKRDDPTDLVDPIDFVNPIDLRTADVFPVVASLPPKNNVRFCRRVKLETRAEKLSNTLVSTLGHLRKKGNINGGDLIIYCHSEFLVLGETRPLN